MYKPFLSRRDFLKLSLSGSLALALTDLRLEHTLAAPAITQGRMTISGVPQAGTYPVWIRYAAGPLSADAVAQFDQHLGHGVGHRSTRERLWPRHRQCALPPWPWRWRWPG